MVEIQVESIPPSRLARTRCVEVNSLFFNDVEKGDTIVYWAGQVRKVPFPPLWLKEEMERSNHNLVW
jgi:hypothetical protein